MRVPFDLDVHFCRQAFWKLKNEQSTCHRGCSSSPDRWFHLAAPAWPLPACDFFRLHGNPKSSAACGPSAGFARASTSSTGRANSA
jgi:hypothetical protein